jgi:hypothetical protein
MQSAAFQGGASCIKDSAAFSFDEPQVSSEVVNASPQRKPEHEQVPSQGTRLQRSEGGVEGACALVRWASARDKRRNNGGNDRIHRTVTRKPYAQAHPMRVPHCELAAHKGLINGKSKQCKESGD